MIKYCAMKSKSLMAPISIHWSAITFRSIACRRTGRPNARWLANTARVSMPTAVSMQWEAYTFALSTLHRQPVNFFKIPSLWLGKLKQNTGYTVYKKHMSILNFEINESHDPSCGPHCTPWVCLWPCKLHLSLCHSVTSQWGYDHKPSCCEDSSHGYGICCCFWPQPHSLKLAGTLLFVQELHLGPPCQSVLLQDCGMKAPKTGDATVVHPFPDGKWNQSQTQRLMCSFCSWGLFHLSPWGCLLRSCQGPSQPGMPICPSSFAGAWSAPASRSPAEACASAVVPWHRPWFWFCLARPILPQA